MGYAHYSTPHGMAGYGVADACHASGCSAEIDRGLAYLCGTDPGRESEHGCGWWFCDAHLCVAPMGIDEQYLCDGCLLKYDGVDDE